MTTERTEAPDSTQAAGPLALRSDDQLGPLPEDPVGVLIRGDGGAWRFSCGEFLLSLYQQPAGDHPLFTEAQVRSMLAAERERCAAWCDNRAAYYKSGDDDGPDSRRAQGARACAEVIRWPANWGRMP